jgi:Type II secretion system (T2SS), protein G
MLKTLAILVILMGFGYAYPPTRARMMLVAKPALVRMGPFGEKAMLPVQRYNTGQEIKFILDQIALARTEGKELPEDQTFQRWLSKRLLTKNNGKDAWNHPYYLIRVGSQVTVGSVGQDGRRGTGDDIRDSFHL